jgi:hypothetical protein
MDEVKARTGSKTIRICIAPVLKIEISGCEMEAEWVKKMLPLADGSILALSF